MGGIVMKTIEERAEEYGSKKGDISLNAVYNEALANIYKEGYIAGATEQKAIDIEKACEWLDNYLMEIGYPDDWMRDSPNMLSGEERFRKAMEE